MPLVIDDLFSFIEASPSPYHAAAAATDLLVGAGFVEVDASEEWGADGAGRGMVFRQGGTVVAVGATAGPREFEPHRLEFRVVGAHTDSPNLRVRPVPDSGAAGYRQLGVEIYGGALANSWLDRDLGLSGRVALRESDDEGDDEGEGDSAGGWRTVLWRCDRPLLRVPQLAIHLDREVNDGLKLDRQQHMKPVWGLGDVTPDGFREFLAEELAVAPSDVVAWDVMAHDLTPPARLGRDGEMYAAARIDNLASCRAAVEALSGQPALSDHVVPVVVLFDHEEIGSSSASGAAGPLLSHLLEQFALSLGADRHSFLRALARSTCVSADGAHAVHPNYPDRHEPQHMPALNGGPVIKTNANVRYATDATGHARFAAACEAAGVPHQIYSHHGALPCGSTIGPITATRLGLSTVDVGSPQLSMHSARELGGCDDPAMLSAALGAFLASA